ncbi:hypothetical protein OIN60_15470 [Paenibacillus sp. P96]|uniref:Uncharacterized protein n=1 Tax=Paenibacillus zeirhizosphaerae TaxID=2987519 RepID=A0ABT9FUM3_9BACL|nr:hypothetical protein [Paenibacillus sp. P96]
MEEVTRTYTSVGTKFTETVLLNDSGLLFNASYEYDKLKADKSLFTWRVSNFQNNKLEAVCHIFFRAMFEML